ncbi:hypothetical protein K2X30_07670 [bacterium]|nr:hypothetical protein [bacterium]
MHRASLNFRTIVFITSLALAGASTGCVKKKGSGPAAATGSVAVPVALVLDGLASSGAGNCITLSVISVDDTSQVLPVNVDTLIQLSTSGSGVFFSDGGCTTSITNVMMPANASQATAYFKDSAVGPQDLSALAPGMHAGNFHVSVQHNPPTQLKVTGSATPGIYACTPYQVELQDHLNLVTVAPADLSVDVSTSGSGKAYSDSSCTNEVTSVAVLAGQNHAIAYFSTLTSGADAIHFNSTGLTADSINVSVNPAPATQLSLVGPAAINTTQCAIYTITSQDSHGVTASLRNDVAVNLNGAGINGSFHSNSACSSPISQVAMLSGSTTKLVYYRQTTATAPITLTADSMGFTSGSVAVSLSNGAASVLSLLSPNGLTFTTQNCVPLTLNTMDASGNVVSVLANTTVSLSTSNGGSFYSNNTCTTTISSVVVSNGTYSKNFWYRKTNVGAVNLTASAPGKFPSVVALTVNAGAATKLAWSSGGTPIASASCQVYTVTAQDANSNATPLLSAINVNLSDASAGGAFYSNSTCTTAVTSMPIAVGASVTASFYYKKTGAGSVSLTASSTGLTSTVKAIVVSTGVPKKIALISAPTAAIVSRCTAINLRLQDEQSIAVNATSAVIVDLAGVGDGGFYSTSACTTAITSKTFAAGQGASSVAVYYKKPTTGSVTLTYTDRANTLTATSGTMIISTGIATKLALTTAPSSISINTCNAYTVQIRDENNQNVNALATTTIDLSTTGTGGLYFPANTCTAGTQITQTTIASGAGSKTYYYKPVNPGAVTLTAASTGLTSATAAVTVANVASKLNFASGPSTLAVGTCGAYVLRTTDDAGVTVNLTAAKTIALSGLSGGAAYYIDPDCSYSIASTSIASGANSATIYVMSLDSNSFTLNGTASGLTPATMGLTVP